MGSIQYFGEERQAIQYNYWPEDLEMELTRIKVQDGLVSFETF